MQIVFSCDRKGSTRAGNYRRHLCATRVFGLGVDVLNLGYRGANSRESPCLLEGGRGGNPPSLAWDFEDENSCQAFASSLDLVLRGLAFSARGPRGDPLPLRPSGTTGRPARADRNDRAGAADCVSAGTAAAQPPRAPREGCTKGREKSAVAASADRVGPSRETAQSRPAPADSAGD